MLKSLWESKKDKFGSLAVNPAIPLEWRGFVYIIINAYKIQDLMNNQDLIDKVRSIESIMIDIATGANYNEIPLYEELRRELLQNILIKDKLPDYFITCRTPQQFWGFISGTTGYQSRRQFIWASFNAIINYLEFSSLTYVETSVISTLNQVNDSYIRDHWQKAIERKSRDPEGAITISRSLIESVCKYILDEKNILYEDTADLPSLYKLTASQLNLSPEQHTEKIFKQILNGCKSVIEGLGAVRNKHGDSHGKSNQALKPAHRHAELVVNLAGTMVSFLLQTHLNNTPLDNTPPSNGEV